MTPFTAMTLRYRQVEDMYPLAETHWLSRPVTVPRRRLALSQAEYGLYSNASVSGTPSVLRAHVVRGDCWHNLWNGRRWYNRQSLLRLLYFTLLGDEDEEHEHEYHDHPAHSTSALHSVRGLPIEIRTPPP